jgi:hypothetical protein
MADFTSFGTTHKAGFTDTIRWKVIVQHESVTALTLERIDDLRIPIRTQCRGNDRLSLAAGENRRAVRPGQDTGGNANLANRSRIPTVDTLLTVQHAIANQPALEFAECAADFVSRKLRIIATCKRLNGG